MSSAKAQLESDTKVCASTILHTYAHVWLFSSSKAAVKHARKAGGVWLLLNYMRMLTYAGVFCYTCMCMLLHSYADVCRRVC